MAVQLQQLLNGCKDAQTVEVAQHLERLNPHGVYLELGLDVFGRCAVRDAKWNESNAMDQYCTTLLRHGKVIKGHPSLRALLYRLPSECLQRCVWLRDIE